MSTGRRSVIAPRTAAAAVSTTAASVQPPLNPDEFVTNLPFKLTAEILERGQERYTIYCAVCHGPSGTGNGPIVRRGYTQPPSYITDNSRQLARSGYQVPLRDVPIGYIFDVATRGYGAMADYSTQVELRDRWAIAAYIRTLQYSQQVPLDDLPAEVREEAFRILEATP
ncbi:MAG TPA: cytochrome c [Pirellulales bacterium]|nr:cytochrome c [Pirellulales bacterium]